MLNKNRSLNKDKFETKLNLTKITKIISIILLISMLILNTNILATSIQGLEDKKANLNDKIEEGKSEQQGLLSNISANMQQLYQIEGQIVENENKIQELKNQEEEAQKSIDELSKELEVLNKETEKLAEITKERIVTIYQSGDLSLITLIANSENLSDMLSNYHLMQQITKMDMELLSRVDQDQKKTKALETELSTKKSLIEKTRKEVEVIKGQQEVLKTDKEVQIANLTAEEEQKRAELAQYDAEMKQADAQIAYLIRQEEIRKAQQNAQNGGTTSDKYVGGIMALPVQTGGWSVTAHYGAGYAQGYPGPFHTGVDFAYGYFGPKAYATQPGTVILASNGYNGGYGNYVVIDHGGGIHTLYAHGASLSVSVGQYLQTGDEVLTIGTTGFSTGNHLHFEVRENGNHVNPRKYINY